MTEVVDSLDTSKLLTTSVAILLFIGNIELTIAPFLTRDAREVRRSLVVCERQIPTHDGGWFSVRIMPYRTQDDKVDGVVITFIDISGLKTLEATLLKALSVLQKQTANRSDDPDSHKELTEVLERVQNLLEKEFSAQPADMQTQEEGSNETG